MNVARFFCLAVMGTVVTVCQAFDEQTENTLAVMREFSISAISTKDTAVYPKSWRCEIDTLAETEVVENCEDWAYDKDEFYIVHGGTCLVFRDDASLKTSSNYNMICKRGHWIDIDKSKDMSFTRRKRGLWNDWGCATGWWGKNCDEPEEKKPPKFGTCRPSDLQEEYVAPAGQKSVTVTWTKPTATDEDGTVSVKQTLGLTPGSSFGGSTDSKGTPYTIMYQATDNDGMKDYCSFSFKVRVKTCGSLAWPSNGDRQCLNDYILGSKCTYSCHKGYTLSSSAYVRCENAANPKWSAVPTCQAISCGSPPNVTDGKVTCTGSTYGSHCTITCEDGFGLDGQVHTQCQHDGTWNWENGANCTDNRAPELTCKSPQTFYADSGMTSTSVTWEEPRAIDSLDPNPVVRKISGPAQGDNLEDGSEYVTYKAIDADGNESPPCTIELRVETTSCGHPLDTLSDKRLRFNCSMKTHAYGDTCTLGCSRNYPLEGPDLITCERNTTVSGEPVGYWSWDTGNGSMPYCEEIVCNDFSPPRDGGLIADTATNGGFPIRVMFCNAGKDIPDLGFNFAGLFVCYGDGTWTPNMTKAPDCSATLSNRGYMLPSKFYYYDGVCNENDTDAILQNFESIVATLHKTLSAICPTSTSCTVGNPTVICGPVSSRRKRRATTREDMRPEVSPKQRTKRQVVSPTATFTFDIVTDFDSSGMTNDEQYAFVDSIQLDQIVPALRENAKNGTYDHPDLGNLTEDAIDFEEYGSPYCDRGSVPVRNTKCNLCPRGYYEVDGTCTECPVGQYSDTSGSATCTGCPDGYSTRQDTSDSLDNCTKLCEAGSYSPDTFVPCAPCRAGYYQDSVGQTSCAACPPGKSTKATGSTTSSDCQYFDAHVVDTAGKTIDADIAILNEFSLSFYVKTVSGSPNMVISVGQELTVIITDDIKVATASTLDVIGQSSPDFWIHIAVYWDTHAGLLTAFCSNNLTARHSSVFPTTSPTVQNGQLSINATSGTGEYISGLRLQSSVVGHVNNATVCQTMADEDVVSMEMLKNKAAQGVTLMVPSVCDVSDACLSSPCGSHGSCTDHETFTCTCFGGWSGETCDIPPNHCIDNDCENGATCVSGTDDYTCQCQPGYSGVSCKTPPVDGVWSSWFTWTECTATCNNGTRERIRACDSPAPGAHGKDCAGVAMESENCNTELCPECPELKRPFGSQLDCDTDPVTVMMNCTPLCRSGFVRPPGPEIDTYTCGQKTGYKWEPMRNIPGCVVPGRARDFTMVATARYDATLRQEDEQAVIDNVKSNVADTDCFESPTCEVGVNINNQASGKKKRSTGSTVILTFLIPIVGTSDLQMDQYAENGTVSPGLQEIIDAINNLESTASAINDSASSFFDVTANGVTYTIDANTPTFEGSASCNAGQLVTGGLCAECPAGSYQFDDYCSLCDKGTYQNQPGQSSCIQCPYGYTTETIGSDDSTECSVQDTSQASTTQSPSNTSPITDPSTTASSTSEPEKDDKETKDQTYVYICIAVGVVGGCITFITVTLLCLKKHFTTRAKVGSRTDLQTPPNVIHDHRLPVYSSPVAPLCQGKLGPQNTKFNRQPTTLTVRDLDIELESGCKAIAATDDHTKPVMRPSRDFENYLYD